MSADKEVLIQIKVDNEAAQKNITEQTKKIDDLKRANELLKKANKETKDGEKLSADQRQRNSEQIAKNTVKIQQANQVRKRAINVQKSEINSLTNMRATLARLTAERNKNLTVGTEAFNKANREINTLSKSIKTAEQGGDDFRRSVGKYPGTFDQVGDSVGKISPALGGMINGFMGATKAALAFIATPIGLVLAAVAAALGSVFQYFQRTEEGGDKLAVAMAYLSGTFQAVMDVVSGLGKLLFDVFVGGFNLIANQFKISGLAMQEVILALDVAWQKVFGSTEDYEKAQQALKENTDEIIKVGKEQIKIVKDTTKAVIDDTVAIVENVAATGEKIEKTAELQRLENDLNKTRRETTVSSAEANRQIFEGLKLAKDETKSFAERRKGLEEASAAETKLSNDKLLIAEKELALIKGRDAVNNSTTEALQEVADAEAKVIEARTASLRTQTKIQASKITLIKQEEAAESKAATAKQKIIDDKVIQEEELLTRTIESEQKLKEVKAIAAAEEITDAEEKLFALTAIEKEKLRIQLEDETLLKADIELLEFESNQRLSVLRENAAAQQDDIRKSNLEKDKKAAEEKKKLNRQVLNQGVSALNDAFAFAQLIAKKDEKLSKALAITKTVVNTAVGIGRAFADLPIYAAIPAAAVVAATGITQIAAISNSGGDGGGTPTPPTGNTPNTPNPQNQADTSNADAAFAEQTALENAIAGMNMNVSVSEINNAQNNVAVSEENSTIGN